METIYYTAVRTIMAYIGLLVLARLMGRKVLSQMNFFNFIAGITIGTITADIAVGISDVPAIPITALLVIVTITLVIEYTNLKSFGFRKLVNSTPTLVIENGRIMDKNLKKLRVTVDDLMMHLREKNIYSVADVEFAMLEIDGQISILPKSQKQPLTPADLNINTKYVGLTKDIVIDGTVMEKNLKEVGLGEEWLFSQLAKQKVQDISEIFYAGLDTSGNLYVSRRTDKSK